MPHSHAHRFLAALAVWTTQASVILSAIDPSFGAVALTYATAATAFSSALSTFEGSVTAGAHRSTIVKLE